MAELTVQLFRDYFGGSWLGKISKNGDFQRDIVFNWPEMKGKFTSFGTEAGLIVPPGGGILDNTKQIIISGWRSDIKRWCSTWHNEFGGHGELQWTSQDIVNGVTFLYGFVHECKQEGDDPTEHILLCEIIDQNNFKYTLQSFRKGIVEIAATRIRTARELRAILATQTKNIKTFEQIASNK
ncbi:MAG: hypothetical protein IPM71_03250 [Bacteroidota bacterium]|nr:MAG: hypothetical protein IPM71_03250 [Bacteroidota bacterium]